MDVKEKEVSLFLDSGAHSLYTKKVINKYHKEGYSFYDTDEFWKYVDDYADFVKKHIKYLDIYANVDVIFNPELSWKVLKYLEKKGLKPLPVVHYGSDLKWLKKHIDEGYDYIGIGGIGQEVDVNTYYIWADRVFDKICDTEKRLPIVKTHGFAVTSVKLLFAYPWYSVDSTSWVLTGRFGSVYVPIRREDKYIYNENSLKICVSTQSPSTKEAGKHFCTLTNREREEVTKYFNLKGFKIGKSGDTFFVEKSYKIKKDEAKIPEALLSVNDKKEMKAGGFDRKVEKIIERGLCNDYKQRDELNIIYFLDLEKNMPEWPWAFKLLGTTKKFGQ